MGSTINWLEGVIAVSFIFLLSPQFYDGGAVCAACYPFGGGGGREVLEIRRIERGKERGVTY